jgi:hypothetical protein
MRPDVREFDIGSASPRTSVQHLARVRRLAGAPLVFRQNGNIHNLLEQLRADG